MVIERKTRVDVKGCIATTNAGIPCPNKGWKGADLCYAHFCAAFYQLTYTESVRRYGFCYEDALEWLRKHVGNDIPDVMLDMAAGWYVPKTDCQCGERLSPGGVLEMLPDARYCPYCGHKFEDWRLEQAHRIPPDLRAG